jgi:hypothetical protein
MGDSSMPVSKKAAFTPHLEVDAVIREEKKKRPWLVHSVALLVLTPQEDCLALTLPQTARDHGVDHVRVPPQLSLLTQSTVMQTAQTIARQLVKVPTRPAAFTYLGSTYGNRRRGGRTVSYAKMVHWVALRLSSREHVFRRDSELYHLSHWCNFNKLITQPEVMAMSARKYAMTMQALVLYQERCHSQGKLPVRARQMLKTG